MALNSTWFSFYQFVCCFGTVQFQTHSSMWHRPETSLSVELQCVCVRKGDKFIPFLREKLKSWNIFFLITIAIFFFSRTLQLNSHILLTFLHKSVSFSVLFCQTKSSYHLCCILQHFAIERQGSSMWQVGGTAHTISGHCDYFKCMDPLFFFSFKSGNCTTPLWVCVWGSGCDTMWRSKSSIHKVM